MVLITSEIVRKTSEKRSQYRQKSKGYVKKKSYYHQASQRNVKKGLKNSRDITNKGLEISKIAGTTSKKVVKYQK